MSNNKKRKNKRENLLYYTYSGKLEKEQYRNFLKKPGNGIDFTEDPFQDNEDTDVTSPWDGQLVKEKKKAIPPSFKVKAVDYFQNIHITEVLLVLLLGILIPFLISHNRDMGEIQIKLDGMNNNIESVNRSIDSTNSKIDSINTHVQILKESEENIKQTINEIRNKEKV